MEEGGGGGGRGREAEAGRVGGRGGSDDGRVERAGREPLSPGGIHNRAAVFSILRQCNFPPLPLSQAFSKPRIYMCVLSSWNLGRTKAKHLLCLKVWAGTRQGGGKDPWEEI